MFENYWVVCDARQSTEIAALSPWTFGNFQLQKIEDDNEEGHAESIQNYPLEGIIGVLLKVYEERPSTYVLVSVSFRA